MKHDNLTTDRTPGSLHPAGSAATLDAAIDALTDRLASRQRDCHYAERDERSKLEVKNATDIKAIAELTAMRQNDQGESQTQAAPETPKDAREETARLVAVGSTVLLGDYPEKNGPHIIYHRKKDSTYKGTLLMETESQAKDLYNSMSAEFRTVLRCAWGQASPRRIDGVYPHTDWEQNDLPAIQVTKENGSVVIREI
jgi:hypothetical protein